MRDLAAGVHASVGRGDYRSIIHAATGKLLGNKLGALAGCCSSLIAWALRASWRSIAMISRWPDLPLCPAACLSTQRRRWGFRDPPRCLLRPAYMQISIDRWRTRHPCVLALFNSAGRKPLRKRPGGDRANTSSHVPRAHVPSLLQSPRAWKRTGRNGPLEDALQRCRGGRAQGHARVILCCHFFATCARHRVRSARHASWFGRCRFLNCMMMSLSWHVEFEGKDCTNRRSDITSADLRWALRAAVRSRRHRMNHSSSGVTAYLIDPSCSMCQHRGATFRRFSCFLLFPPPPSAG